MNEFVLPAEPTIEATLYLLENPSTWPPNFEWDYQKKECCGLGLMAAVWGGPKKPDDETNYFAWGQKVLGMTYDEVLSWAVLAHSPFWIIVRDVTPQEVADKIRFVLAQRTA